MIRPGRDALVAELIARFLRRLAGVPSSPGAGRRKRRKGDDPWPGRVPDPLQPEVLGVPDGEGPDDPNDPGDPDTEDPGDEVDIDDPDDPDDPNDPGDPDTEDPGDEVDIDDPDDPDDPDEPGGDLEPGDPGDGVDVVVEKLLVGAVDDEDDFQSVYTVGAVATDWDVLAGAFTKQSADTLRCSAVETSDPLACALWNGRDYGDAQISCLIYATLTDFGLWYAVDDGSGNINGYQVHYDNTGPVAGTYTVARYDAGVRTVLASVAGGAAAVNSRLVLVRRGAKIALVNITSAGAVALTLSANDTTYSRGQCGVGGGPTQPTTRDYRQITIGPPLAA